MSDVIFTPVYRGEIYLYHECSECLYHVAMRGYVSVPLYFSESFKFCPNCGGSVVRFANLPKFKEEFNRAAFGRLVEIDQKYRDELDYYCRVTLSKTEFEELKKKCQFAVALKRNGDVSVLSPSIELVDKMSSKSWNHWEIKKLKERMGKADA